MFDSLRTHGLKPAGSSGPWNSPGKNTAVGSHSFFQGISGSDEGREEDFGQIFRLEIASEENSSSQ